MREKMPVEDLRAGMYVAGLDRPLMKHSFLLENAGQIEALKRAGILHAYIDTEKGRDDTEEARISTADSLSRKEIREYSGRKEELFQVNRQNILKGSFVDFSIFLKTGLTIAPFIRYHGRDIEVTDEVIGTAGEFLILHEDFPQYKAYLAGVAIHRATDTSLQTIKDNVIRENTKILVKELLSEPFNGDKIKECAGAVEDIMNALHESGGLVASLLTLNKHDYYTYTHSVDVCVLSLGLAMTVGIDKDREIYCAGIGSLLHDIGKSAVPPEILNKPGTLSAGEFEIMQQHVIKGFDMLKANSDVPADALYPLLEHHERVSGTGYPGGLKAEELHLTGKIAAIADTFDALTTGRPYQKTMTPFEALERIKSLGEHYDMELFQEFVKMLGKHSDGIPPGRRAGDIDI